MLWFCDRYDDPEYARQFAASVYLRDKDSLAHKLRPYIEEALGRPITDAEMAAGRVDGFVPPAANADFWHPDVKDLL